MQKFSKKNIMNFIYMASIVVTFTITAVIFSILFIIGPNGIFNTGHPENPTDPTKDPPNDKSAQIAEIQKQIDAYDEILNDKYMIIANKDTPLPKDYIQSGLSSTTINPAIKLESITDLHFKEFIEAAVYQGIPCTLVTGYRTKAEQNSVYNSALQSYANAGYTLEKAEIMTNRTIAKAGESEFETGYLIEITSVRGISASEMTESELFKFAKENMYKYGFILRYPEGKEQVTGYDYNPFIFRYVGFVGDTNHAQYIYEKSITLEEYIEYIKGLRANAQHDLDELLGGK